MYTIAKNAIIAAKSSMLICSTAFAQMPATTAPDKYMARALRRYSFQTFQSVLSDFIATKAETVTELTQNCANAITSNSHTNELVFSVRRLLEGIPNARVTTTHVMKTDIEVISVLIATVLHFIGTPCRFRFSEANAVSRTAVNSAIWPPYISRERKTRASEIVKCILV